jgi:hypothetical protein
MRGERLQRRQFVKENGDMLRLWEKALPRRRRHSVVVVPSLNLLPRLFIPVPFSVDE